MHDIKLRMNERKTTQNGLPLKFINQLFVFKLVQLLNVRVQKALSRAHVRPREKDKTRGFEMENQCPGMITTC